MIILILLILLFQNKFSNKLTNNNYLLLLLLLILSTNDYNSNLNSLENICFNPIRPNNNVNYNYHKNYSNRTPYNKDDYLKNYNKTNIKEPNNKNNTCSCNEYYNKKQYSKNSINTNYNRSNNAQYIQETVSDKCESINTISSQNHNIPDKKENSFDTSNKNSSKKSSLKSTNTNSTLNKNITCNKSISLPTNKNSSSNLMDNTTKTNSLDYTNKINKHSSINFNNISKGESITVVLEGFGIITGKLLSHSNDVISLKLKDNRTIFINTNFISLIN